MSNRNLTVDVAKGIGIILVVLGHNWIVLHEKNELFRVIFSFHVPLFFFISGLFINDHESINDFLISKSDSLLKPYFVVAIVVGLFRVVVSSNSFFEYFAGVVYATGETIAWVPLWFLPHLFVSLFISLLVLKVAKYFKNRIVVVSIFMIVFLVVGSKYIGYFSSIDTSSLTSLQVLLGPRDHLPGLPFSFDLIGVSSAFILFGYLLRDRVKLVVFKPLIFFCVLCVFIFLQYFFDETIDLNSRHYGNLIVSTAEAVFGIYIVISVSAYISAKNIFCRSLGYVGYASLFILVFHAVLQGKAFSFISRIYEIGFISGFVALVASVVCSLIIFEMVQRIYLAALLLLPIKSLSSFRRQAIPAK